MSNTNSSRIKDQVYQLLMQVPRGRVTTYGELARALGTKGYRAIGRILHNNPNAPLVPCHRVVKSDGSLGGYAYGTSRKIELLTKEGIQIEGDKVLNFKSCCIALPRYTSRRIL